VVEPDRSHRILRARFAVAGGQAHPPRAGRPPRRRGASPRAARPRPRHHPRAVGGAAAV